MAGREGRPKGKKVEFGMDLFEYDDYEHYVRAQTQGNKDKISMSGIGLEIIGEIQKRIPYATHILCHGTRGGWEQEFFQQAYGEHAFVWGTEISSTVKERKIPRTTQWDFTLPMKRWIGKFDIVFSNSLDHSIDPRKTLTTWVDQLRPTGSLILEMHLPKEANDDWVPTKTDPLAYTSKEMIALLKDMNLKIVDQWLSPKFTDYRGAYGVYASGRPTLRIQK